MQIVEPVLGTRAEVHVAAHDLDVSNQTEDEIIQEVRRLESLFTVFVVGSALNTFRRTGATDVPELLEVHALALEWQRRTRGAFDPRVQQLMQLWDEGEAAGVVPSPAMRAQVLAERAVFFVRKKEGDLRLVCDYRALNKLTIPDANPVPLISEALDQVSDGTVFSKIDLLGAYRQMRIREEDIPKTAIRTRYGSFE